MEKSNLPTAIITILSLMALLSPAQSLVPYTRPSSVWDMMMFPPEDPFRILEDSPLASISRGADDGAAAQQVALARADWRETPAAHEISLDVPGLKKDDVRVEVDEGGRVLRVSGERRTEEEVKDERWHRVERTVGKFWRRFRLPENADVENVSARLEDGVLRINVAKKVGEQEKKEPKVISIVSDEKGNDKENVVKMAKQEL